MIKLNEEGYLWKCKRCGSQYLIIEGVGGNKARFNQGAKLCFDCINELNMATPEQLSKMKKDTMQLKLGGNNE